MMLRQWVPKIGALHAGGRPVHVLVSNCWHGFAVRNARLLAQDLG
jgi:uncharacterized protein YecE (DUF72 family)